MNSIKLITLLLMILATAACTREDGVVPAPNVTVYFQVEYQNYAWGPQHKGFIIDQQGNIHEYDQPEGWIFPEDDQISQDDFSSNLEKTQVRLAQISGEDLNRMLNLVKQVEYGDLTKLKHVMADAGEDTYCVYVTSDGNPKLTKYLLQMRGDFYQKNTSSAADTITNWLIGLRDGPVFGPEPFED